MANTVVAPEPIGARSSRMPELRDGVRLTRDEFRRLRELHPEIRRVERIDGVVVMPAAAVRFRHHGQPHSRLSRWLGAYEDGTPGVESSLATTTAIGDDHDPEPDSLLFVSPEFGGRCVVTDEDYLEGSPELLGEISGSTAPKDLGRKLRIYEEHGVEEYIVWLTETPEIRWHRLRNGVFERLEPDATGIVRSEVFPGLWLDVPAMLRGEMRRVSEVLDVGMASAERAAFVRRLADQRQPGGAP